MSKKNIIIASHSADEAITQCIIKNKHHIEENIKIVLLQELLTDFDIFDEIGDKVQIIRWYKGENTCLSNTDYLLLNRVLYIPYILFKDFIKNDKEYAQRELEAYIGFAFNAFSGMGNKSANGICENILSLPQQWNSIKKELNLNTPNYYWGPRDKHNLNKKTNLIYSKIYNFINWSTTNNAPKENHIFCFEKPQGNPVFILSIGRKQLMTSSMPISTDLEIKIKKFAKIIHHFLNYFISEILIFVDGLTLTFGCINHEIIRSTKNIGFDIFVCHNLMNEFYECAN